MDVLQNNQNHLITKDVSHVNIKMILYWINLIIYLEK